MLRFAQNPVYYNKNDLQYKRIKALFNLGWGVDVFPVLDAEELILGWGSIGAIEEEDPFVERTGVPAVELTEVICWTQVPWFVTTVWVAGGEDGPEPLIRRVLSAFPVDCGSDVDEADEEWAAITI